MAEQRKDSRSAASLKVKYKSATVDDFAQQFGTDVSRGGIFIKTKSPLEAGALLKLELQLSTAAAVISGIGRVAWRRATSIDTSRPAGMGIKFIKLEPASQAIVERIVAERGATPSRFDQSEGAELARASLEPPAPSLAPDRTSAPDRISSSGADDGPPTVRPPAPIAVPAAAIANKAPVASKPFAAAPAGVLPNRAPVPVAGAAVATATPSLGPSAATRSSSRIGPTKAAIPSGLFAQSPLVQQPVIAASLDEKRTSFFPPALQPSVSPAARGGSTASGQLSSPRLSSGSSSSPLHRPLTSRAPGPQPGARSTSAATGPKGVFGGPAPVSPLPNSSSGMMRPATEVSGRSSNSLLPDRSADEMPTAAVPRPPGGRAVARSAQPSAAPVVATASVLDSLASDVFGDDADSASDDGMFATLEPVGGLAEPAPQRISRPSGAGSAASRVTPAPTAQSAEVSRNGHARDSAPNQNRGLAAAEAADVDNLFADLEDSDDATTDELARPSAAAAVFSPGSTRPSMPPRGDDLLTGDAFGEADLLGGEDKGVPPFDDADEEEDEQVFPAAASAASEPPMLRLAELAAEAKPEAKRTPVLMIVLGVIVLLAIIGAVIVFMKPSAADPPNGVEGRSTEAAPAAPPSTEANPQQPATPVPAQPTAAQAAEAQAALPAGEMIEVNVTSLPRGAAVRIGGVVVGETPTNVDLPLERDTIVTVGAPGYAPQSKTVTAARGMEPLRFKLEPLPYVLVVATSPAQAELTVGSTTSISPAPLALGHITGGVDVTISKDGYRRMTRQVRLDEFVERDGVLRAEIEVSLSPMPGTVVPPPAAAPQAASPAPEPRRSSRRSRRGAPESAPAPPEPENEAAPSAEAAPEAPKAEEPAKPEGAPPPPALPSLPE